MRVGQSVVQARAICPEAQHAVAAQELAATRELEELLSNLSPQVEVEGDGVFFLGCRGLERLHGPEESFRDLVRARLRERGWSASLGLADTRFVAFAAAVCGEVVVPAGRGRGFLAELPLAVLPVSEDLAERLRSLGLKTVGEFADLPAPSVEVRYGLEGVHFHRLARGEDHAVLCLSVPEEVVRARREVLATRLAELERPVQELLEEVMAKMRRRNRSCATLAFQLQMEDGSRRELEVTTGRPCVRVRVFRDLLVLGLQGLELPDRVVEVEVEVRRERKGAGEQGHLFGDRAGLEGELPSRLRAALGWLQALYGEEAVVYPQVEDSLRPEKRRGRTLCSTERPARISRSRELLYGAGESWVCDSMKRPEGTTLSPVLRLLDPPVRLDVNAGQRLEVFRWAGGTHRVRAMVGPQRLNGEWWETPFERDYFETLTHDAGLFWLFYSRRERQWYLQGIFD